MGKKACRMEVPLPKNFRDCGQSRNYSNVKNPPSHISTQFLDKKSDMERLVDKGLENPKWFKGFLSNVGMKKTLDYAEECIKATNKLNEQDRTELLNIIDTHSLRQQN